MNTKIRATVLLSCVNYKIRSTFTFYVLRIINESESYLVGKVTTGVKNYLHF